MIANLHETPASPRPATDRERALARHYGVAAAACGRPKVAYHHEPLVQLALRVNPDLTGPREDDPRVPDLVSEWHDGYTAHLAEVTDRAASKWASA